MKLRITLLIPALLVFSALVSSVLVYFYTKTTSEKIIRKEQLSHARLNITQLQNVLYNSLTENRTSIEDARLNVSVAAMDPDIKLLLITDESGRILISNRYSYEDKLAEQVSQYYEKAKALDVENSNIPDANYVGEKKAVLASYYPMVLQLEKESGAPTKQVGVLYAEFNVERKLNGAAQLAAKQSFIFAVIMLFAAILVAWLLHRRVSSRIIQLSNTSKRLAAGNFDARTELHGQDELAMLAKLFDEMALRIKENVHSLTSAKSELSKLNETLEFRVEERTALLHNAQSIGHIGNWSWDVQTDELYWSDELFKIFGYQPNEIKPNYLEFMSMLHSGDVGKVTYSEAEQEEREDNKVNYEHFDHRIILPDGSERWVHEEVIVEISKISLSGKLSGTIQDITERKLFENNLRDAKIEAERLSEAKSDFLSRMSHELRTPMNAILGFAQLLEMENVTYKQRGFIGEIVKAGTHLLELIGDLLDLSRIEAGTPLVELETVQLQEVIKEAIKITEALILENNLSLILECSADCKVMADKFRLRQVLVNLLSNAAKYNKEGCTITVCCLLKRDVIRIMITDEGNGLDPEQIEKLFVPFERLGAEFTGINGSGIGLALSKQLVELMNGRIGVESQSGAGSTFWVEIAIVR